jgi:predicted nucleic acid-binding protein
MNEDVAFIAKHQQRGALLDANILLVYVVGMCDTRLLPQFHHTKQYKDDFPLIQRLVNHFRLIYTTPHVLTEVSNLGKKLGEKLSPRFFDELQKVVQVLEERSCTSKDATANRYFRTLGLTDAALLHIAVNDILVITADLPLYLTLRHTNIDAVNINHLRPYTWS